MLFRSHVLLNRFLLNHQAPPLPILCALAAYIHIGRAQYVELPVLRVSGYERSHKRLGHVLLKHFILNHQAPPLPILCALTAYIHIGRAQYVSIPVLCVSGHEP